MKNLRKKLALLLAFVMVLSLVPATSVFGRVPGPAPTLAPGITVDWVETSANTPNNGQFDLDFFAGRPGTGQARRNFQFTIDNAWFDGLNTLGAVSRNIAGTYTTVPAFAVRVQVSGGDRPTTHAYPSGATDVNNTQLHRRRSTLGDAAGAYPIVSIGGQTDVVTGQRPYGVTAGLTRGYVQLTATNDDGRTIAGTNAISQQYILLFDGAPGNRDLVITAGATIRRPEDTVSVYISREGQAWVRVIEGLRLYADPPAVAPPGVTPAYQRRATVGLYGDPVAFTGWYSANIDRRVELRETHAGAFGDNVRFDVQMDAPAGYRWELNTLHLYGVGGLAGVTGRVIPTPGLEAVPVAGSAYIFDGGRLLRFSFYASGRAAGPAGVATGTFRVGGVNLSREDMGAALPAAHDVEVRVILEGTNRRLVDGNWQDVTTGAGNLGRANIDVSQRLLVAQFSPRGTLLSVGELPDPLVSGFIGETAPIILTELHGGSIHRGSIPLTIRLDNPDAQIVGATVRTFVVDEPDYYTETTIAQSGATRFGEHFVSINMVNSLFEYYDSVPHVMEIVLDVFLPPNVQRNFVRNTISAQVELLGQHGIVGATSVTIAAASDPIRIGNVNPARITPHGADWVGIMLPTNLPSVTITETVAGGLDTGMLVVYVASTVNDGSRLFGGVGVNLGFSLDARVISGDLMLGQGTLTRGTGIWAGIDRIAFPVHRASSVPSTIVFENIRVDGTIANVPGVEIALAFSGNALIEGWVDHASLVYPNFTANPLPYSVVLGYIGEQLIDDGPGIGVTPPPTPGFTPPPTPTPPALPLPPATIVIPTGDFVAHTFPAGYTVAMVPVSAMAALLNASYSFISPTAVEISGVSTIGAEKTIRLFIHQTDALVRGVGTDIGHGSVNRLTGEFSGSPGTIWPVIIDGQFMVPVRFIANSFGYTDIQGTPFGLFLGN